MTEKLTIYQTFPRLHGNRCTANIPGGSIEQNGCGKMADFTDAELARIRDFGFSHVWYTGLIEHAGFRDNPAVVKGRAGSPYAIKDYYDIDPDLAVDPERRMQEFEALVERTHRAGLKMIMDFVPNHVAREYGSDVSPAGIRDLGADDDTSQAFSADNNFYYIPGETLHVPTEGSYTEFPARATGNDRFDAWPQRDDWYETVKLNYGVDYCGGRSAHFDPIPDTWKKMTAILLFWAGKGADAFRCDMAEMVPVDFWHYAISRVKKVYPEIRFIAEIYNPSSYRSYIRYGGFDYLYDKVGLYDTLRSVVCGHAPAAAITSCWQCVDDIQGHMLNFLENHDEQRIASDFFCGDGKKARPAMVVSALLNTCPVMIYAGQEVGERSMEASGFSGADGRTTIFDFWGVEGLRKVTGSQTMIAAEHELYVFYKRLMRLCCEEQAIRLGLTFDLMYVNYDGCRNFDPQRHFAFLRHYGEDTLLIAVNFSETKAEVGVRIPEHAFDCLALRPTPKIEATDLLTGNKQSLCLMPDEYTEVWLPAHGALVLKLTVSRR